MQPCERAAQEGLVDVEEDEPLRPLPPPGVEEQPDLPPRARPQLDDLARTRPVHDLARDALQDAELGAGRVVLGEPGDLLEEPAAAVVVEVLAGQLGEGTLQALPHLLGHQIEAGEALRPSRGCRVLYHRWNLPLPSSRQHVSPGSRLSKAERRLYVWLGWAIK